MAYLISEVIYVGRYVSSRWAATIVDPDHKSDGGPTPPLTPGCARRGCFLSPAHVPRSILSLPLSPFSCPFFSSLYLSSLSITPSLSYSFYLSLFSIFFFSSVLSLLYISFLHSLIYLYFLFSLLSLPSRFVLLCLFSLSLSLFLFSFSSPSLLYNNNCLFFPEFKMYVCRYLKNTDTMYICRYMRMFYDIMAGRVCWTI
jgi:hypothetical protein